MARDSVRDHKMVCLMMHWDVGDGMEDPGHRLREVQWGSEQITQQAMGYEHGRDKALALKG